MQQNMLAMLDEVDASLDDLHHVAHDLHQPQDLFEAFGLKEALEKLLTSKENCLSDDGQFLILTPEECEQLQISFDQSNSVSIYTICTQLVTLLAT